MPVVAAPPPRTPVPLIAADLLGGDYLARLRDATAADFGRLLVELWKLGTPAARTRFREVFDQWCLLDPEAASRWSVTLSTKGIGGLSAPTMREQSLFAWADQDLDAAYTWTLAQGEVDGMPRDSCSLAAALLRRLDGTDPAHALVLAHRSPDDVNKIAFQSILQTRAKTNPPAALQALNKEPKLDHAGGDLEARLVGIRSEHDLEAATRWVLSTDVSPEAGKRLISGLAQPPKHPRAVLHAILAWWDSRRATAPPEEKPHLSNIFRRWAETDAEDALEFADSLPDDLRPRTLFQAGLASFSYYGTGWEKTLRYDPISSLAYIALLPKGSLPVYGTSR